MKSLVIKQLVFLFFIVLVAKGQNAKQKIINKNWILTSEKIEQSSEVKFTIFTQNQISLNTMIWKFLANGGIEVDYQSSDDVEACLGVDFLDLDLNYSTWKIDPKTQKFILTLKGGYASVDDFLFKKEFDYQDFFDENGVESFKLIETKVFYFKDLTEK